MARTRSIAYALDSTTIAFLYRRNNPSTGLYFDSTKVTACTIEVRDVESPGTPLLATAAMTYVASLKGYRYVWTYGAALNGVRIVSVIFSPTRAGGVAAALAPEEAVEIDLADVLERIDLSEAATLSELGDPSYGLAAIRTFLDGISGGAGFTDSDRETLTKILAKEGGIGSGGVAIVTPNSKQIAQIAADAAAAVWKAKKRSLTEPVEIDGQKRRLDDLNDVSRDEVKEAAREALQERPTENVADQLIRLESKDSAAVRVGKLGGAIVARLDQLEHRLAYEIEEVRGALSHEGRASDDRHATLGAELAAIPRALQAERLEILAAIKEEARTLASIVVSVAWTIYDVLGPLVDAIGSIVSRLGHLDMTARASRHDHVEAADRLAEISEKLAADEVRTKAVVRGVANLVGRER